MMRIETLDELHQNLKEVIAMLREDRGPPLDIARSG